MLSRPTPKRKASLAPTWPRIAGSVLGEPRCRTWLWAVLLATGLELAMLLTPYPQFFAIPVTGLFVAVTLTAHLVFGVALGLVTKWWAVRWELAGASH